MQGRRARVGPCECCLPLCGRSRRANWRSGSTPSAAGSRFSSTSTTTGRQRIVELGDRTSVSVGRSPSSDVPLAWDHEVSRLHAVLACEGGAWTIADEGLSRNGSFVNGRRLRGRRRLRDGDAIKIGGTLLVFLDGDGGDAGTTTAATPHARAARAVRGAAARARLALRPARRRRPTRVRARTGRSPRTCSSASRRSRRTCARCSTSSSVGDLPQNRKRAELVRRPFEFYRRPRLARPALRALALRRRLRRRPCRPCGRLRPSAPSCRPGSNRCCACRCPTPCRPSRRSWGRWRSRAARALLMPFLRRPSYCLSSLMLGPWSFDHVSLLRLAGSTHAARERFRREIRGRCCCSRSRSASRSG